MRIDIPSLGFGGAPLGNMFREVSDADARATLEAAWDAGIRLYDTSPHYGAGLSERRFAEVLADKPRDDFVLCSKVGRLLEPADQPENAPPFVVRQGAGRAFVHYLFLVGRTFWLGLSWKPAL